MVLKLSLNIFRFMLALSVLFAHRGPATVYRCMDRKFRAQGIPMGYINLVRWSVAFFGLASASPVVYPMELL
jgi:hypothetical protein